MKILVATEKPFAPVAVAQIKDIVEQAGHEFALLEKYSGQQELIQQVSEANALIVRSDDINKDVVASAPNLKIIVRAGAGYDNIDLASSTNANIVVMNTPGQNANAVAELALGMMVYVARNQFNGSPGTELLGKTLGIHAYGNVGRRVAAIARGFGMTVYAFDPFINPKGITNDGVKVVGSEIELYDTCQYVSLHIPANEQTIKSINEGLMAVMPDNPVLVNTARKEVIDEVSLMKVLQARDDFRYASDIAPDCAGEISGKFPGRCYFTPKKMGAQTAEANINAGLAAANQIVKFFATGDITFKVN